MKKLIPALIPTLIKSCLCLSLLSSIYFTTALANTQPSFSELRIGFENITYSETLSDVANLGRLSQSVSVTNPVVKQVSYSGINENWGFYIESSTTLSADITTEAWSIGEFGNIQENAFKIKVNDIGGKVAYHYSTALQFSVGSKIYTSSFTRSNFDFVQPGAYAFDQKLITLSLAENSDEIARFLLPSQNTSDADTPQQVLNNKILPVVSVSEDQMGVLITTGVKYDTRLQSSKNFSWYIEGEVSLPVYTEVQNTQHNTTILTDYFNGWGVSARVGMRYHFTDNIALIFGVDGLYKERDTMTKVIDNGSRLRVPNIEYSNIAYTTGIYWRY